MSAQVFMGIDVSKATLDLGNTERHLGAFDNDAKGRKKLVSTCLKIHKETPLGAICVESTGCYSHPVVDELFATGLPVCHVQPNRVRHFAQSAGILAKTDAIDACVIARFGQKIEPRLFIPHDPANKKLRALIDRRDQVVDDRKRESSRLEACQDKEIARMIRAQIKLLKKQEEKLTKEIGACIAAHDDLKAKDAVLQKVSGVGLLTSALVLAYLPELGTVNRQHIAALAGLAPYNNDSGARQGKRKMKGGRARVRKGFFMSILSAARYNPVLSKTYQRLLEKGKEKMVAGMACARKLIVHLNSLIAEHLANSGTAPAQPA